MDTQPDPKEIETRERFKDAREAILAVLKQHHIATVEITYDGCGDSGQIESISAYDAASQDVDVSAIPCHIAVPQDDGSDPPIRTKLDAALDDFAWEIILALHGYFYDGCDGAFGTFTIDVAAGRVSLDHNERFTDTTLYQTEL